MNQKYDFDTVINRRHTGSLRWDVAIEKYQEPELIPLTTADMDFQTAPCVIESLERAVKFGIFGYSEPMEDYYQIFIERMKRIRGWNVKKEWICHSPGVVNAVAYTIWAMTNKGDKILLPSPMYHPFAHLIENNQRKLVRSSLVLQDGKYKLDFSELEREMAEHIRMMIFCNPHNPTGRVFTKDELEKIIKLCRKYDVLLLCDEIHADFIFKGKHQVFANVKKEYEQNSIVCTSPSKTFNLAGLQISNILIPNEELRNKFKQEIEACGYSQPNVMGIIACEAAYKYGNEWYQAMHQYIKENIQFTKEYIEKNIPQIKIKEPEGTYLVWLDFRNFQLSEEQLEDLITNKAKLWLDGGTMFGEDGKGFQRINVACQRATLEKALNQLKDAIDEIK